MQKVRNLIILFLSLLVFVLLWNCDMATAFQSSSSKDFRVGTVQDLHPGQLPGGNWFPLMMRSQEEDQLGLAGAGSEQHFHGIARSQYNPDYIYACQDITGPWRSRDGGETWQKTLDRGIMVTNSDSIEVDPVDPNKVFSIMESWNGYRPQGLGGIYRSLNGGDDWELVMNVEWDPSYTFEAWDGPRPRSPYLWSGDTDITGENTASFNHRYYSHNIAWSPVGVDPSNSPDLWFAALPRDYLYYSNDGGTTWLKGADIKHIQFIYAVYADPWNQNNVYLATDRGFYVSTDRGLTVHRRGTWYTYDLGSDPLVEGRDGPQGHSTIVTYPDLTQTDHLHRNMRVQSLALDPQVPGKMWAVGRWLLPGDTAYYQTRERLFVSYDYGENWLDAPGGGYGIEDTPVQPWNGDNLPNLVFIHPADGNYLYVTNRWGFTHNYSTDGGQTWQSGQYSESFPGFGRDAAWRNRMNGGMTGIVPNYNDVNDIVAYSHATFWKSTDAGNQFHESSAGFNGIAWSWYKKGIAFDAFDPGRWATFNCDVSVRITENNGRYFFSPDNLSEINTWKADRLTMGQGSHAGAIQPIMNSQVMVASIGQYFKVRLMRSTDGGRNWSLIDNLPSSSGTGYDNNSYYQGSSFFFIDFHREKPNILWAEHLISYDAGETFELIDFGLDCEGKPYKSNPSVQGYCYQYPDTVYGLANHNRGIVRSDDGGRTWRHYNSTDRHGQIPHRVTYFDRIPFFAVNSTNPDIVYVHSDGGGVAAYDGTGWTDIFPASMVPGVENGNFIRAIAVDPQDGDVIYIAGFMPGYNCFFRTTDGGQTWTNISENLPRIGNCAMEVNPHTRELMMGSFIGTWVYPAP